MVHPLEVLSTGGADGRIVYPEHDYHASAAQWWAQCAGAAQWLRRGDGAPSIGVVQDTSPGSQQVVVGGWRIGRTMVSLPVPPRAPSELAAYTALLETLAHQCGFATIVVPAALASVLGERLGTLAVWPCPEVFEAAPLYDEDWAACFVQCTSGTTGRPKGVILDLARLGTHLEAMTEVIDARDPLHGVSWLPPSHDMGFVGMFLVSACDVARRGAELVMISPTTYVRHPGMWPELLGAHQARLSAAPDTTWRLLARGLARPEVRYDLSTLRNAMNGSEALRWETQRAVVTHGARHGLDPGALRPCYGMAEMGLAVSILRPGQRPRGYVLERAALADDRVACVAVLDDLTGDDPVPEDGVVVCTGAGQVLPGVELRIETDTGAVLDASSGRIGRIAVRSEQLCRGYTDGTQIDAWYRTPDLGYLTEDGEVVVLGRADDVVVVAGQKFHPDDLERAADGVDGIRSGRVAAIEMDGHWVMVYVARADADPDTIARAIRHNAQRLGMLIPHGVLAMPEDAFLTTSSGKPRRRAIRARVLHGS